MQSTTPTASTVRPFRAPTQTTADSFQATELLHDGPWSKVYRVRPLRSRTAEAGQYALKMPASETDSLTAENMLRREARIMQAVRQPNLISLLSWQTTRRPYYLLTPYLEGATLGDVLNANLRIPIRHALWIVRQTAQALDALHSLGWLHGDIKPENIHVAPSGHATLMDLGMARRLDGDATRGSRTAITGTLKYAAPEMFCQSTSLDQRSDIYSLGVIFYQLLAGHPPFTAPNAASLTEMHLHTTPAELTLPRCTVAADIRELIARMLAKVPLRRPQSASELAQRLTRLEIAMMCEVK